ncbi:MULTISPECIES: replication-relaxation family protein [Priestia]|uniref:Uncharacterized protein n=2 Tax=Priestia TaxID=2800373 RepID=A0A0V8JRY4_9BACI|nr:MULTISPECIES: replication-relaxation family protein [Priestia]KSU89794.1 hypothetical protein AS180_00035 [Priestia veravalensis]MBN8253933.1 replication-relaxation family protein [Priestia flexa]SCB73580.1 hypothetical protein GA0061087_10017 [Priestia flexa]
MNSRDKAIIENLKKFRVLNRDQLIKLHFIRNSTPHVVANRVLKRLVDSRLIEVDKTNRPYNYFPSPRSIKKDSTKIPHFRAIADFYITLCAYEIPSQFEVEFKPLAKGGIEPDVFMKWKGFAFCVEVQRSIYSKKQMQNKHKLYMEYKDSGKWQHHSKRFPAIWILTDKYYDVDFQPLNAVQTKDVDGIFKYFNS